MEKNIAIYSNNPEINSKIKKLIEKICLERAESIKKIQLVFRCYLIKKIIRNQRECFLLKSGINITKKNTNQAKLSLKMSLFSEKEEEKNNNNKKFSLYEFNYNTFYKKFILFLPRCEIKNCKYKLEFLRDNEPMIDPSFSTEEDNGEYFNVIDFNQVRQNEIKFYKKSNKIKTRAINQLKKKGLISTKKNEKIFREDWIKRKNVSSNLSKSLSVCCLDDLRGSNEVIKSFQMYEKNVSSSSSFNENKKIIKKHKLQSILKTSFRFSGKLRKIKINDINSNSNLSGGVGSNNFEDIKESEENNIDDNDRNNNIDNNDSIKKKKCVHFGKTVFWNYLQNI